MKKLRKRAKSVSEREETQADGSKLKIRQVKPRDKKKVNYVARHTVTSCPNCLSTMILDEAKVFKCTGNKLQLWESDFARYNKMSDKDKTKYITELSNYSRFLELYDRWEYALKSDGEEKFDCGYTNILFPPNGNSQVRIPDPSFTKILEKKLGRPLTEEEKHEESELFFYAGRVLTTYKEGAKLIRIPWLILPSEVTIYLPKEKEEIK
jgi:hypothetical protein